MYETKCDVAILYEHPEWHEPLFDELTRAEIRFAKIDLKNGAVSLEEYPDACLYYNLVSPSAYTRGNQHAIQYARALCGVLESKNRRVLNGTKSYTLEFSKSAQLSLLSAIGARHPRTIIFNNVRALRERNDLEFPMILKPEQGGSGARMFLANSLFELENLLHLHQDIWLPDNLLLLQEKLENDPLFGIVRVEFVGTKMLYAMRVVTNGVFNLCPSVYCNPEDSSAGSCLIPIPTNSKPEFYPYLEITPEEIDEALRVFMATGHDIGCVEYIIQTDGSQVFYDINANSNLRASVAKSWNVDPFEEVVKYLIKELRTA